MVIFLGQVVGSSLCVYEGGISKQIGRCYSFVIRRATAVKDGLQHVHCHMLLSSWDDIVIREAIYGTSQDKQKRKI